MRKMGEKIGKGNEMLRAEFGIWFGRVELHGVEEEDRRRKGCLSLYLSRTISEIIDIQSCRALV